MSDLDLRKSLGRRPQQDRNMHHLAVDHRASDLASVVSQAAHHIWPKRPGILDQGNTGTCVGHGFEYRLRGAPFSHKEGVVPDAFAIYDLATTLDPWTDNDHDLQSGTSVLAGVKALIALGYAEGHYDWIYDADTAVKWLTGKDADGRYVGGPLVIGVAWYDSMFETDDYGFVRIAPGSRVVGGHCLEVDLADQTMGCVGGPNSWGDWGEDGRWKMDLATLDRLLKEDGEAVIITEKRGP
jgi:hypothetical protein